MGSNVDKIERFIKKLARETTLSQENASIMVRYIDYVVGNISNAKRIYYRDEIGGLQEYIKRLESGVIY